MHKTTIIHIPQIKKKKTRNLAIANNCAHNVTTVLKWPSKVTQGHRYVTAR